MNRYVQPASRRHGAWPSRRFYVVLAALTSAAVSLAQDKPVPAAPRQLSVEIKPAQGDFDQMLQRRVIRVALPYSRTLFFIDRGQERGLTAENMRDFERWLNRKYARQLGQRPLTVILIPTTRDKMFTRVKDGYADIAAGNLTVTDERLKLVDFAMPNGGKTVRELVVSGPNAPELKTLDDLAGKTVHVRLSTSYADSLTALNKRLTADAKAPVKLAALPDALEDEDKLEMLNAGLIDLVVVDDWKAHMWAQVLPNIKVREDLVLRGEGKTGWAIRKGSPKLDAEILDFYANYTKKQGVLDYRLAQYFKRVKQIDNNASGSDIRRFNGTVTLFRKYGAQYGFDPLMLAAQGYQESQLRQEVRSKVGAIGVMQVMPATGKQLNVGDITSIEPNIHAGTKYMDQLMTKYFADAKFSDADRALFAFASYNAGPGNIAKMRNEAEKRRLDPDLWFNNVEVVTAEKIGLETTTYVRNIYKYYVAYRMLTDAQAAVESGRQEVTSPPKK
ncbi:MAG TPA: lytic transglycosylase F [Burkholderiaceae bacterium]|nr:lytic transglycosylase F [Burkholderiaceae bacterium]